MFESLKSIKNAIKYFFETFKNKNIYKYYNNINILSDEETIKKIIQNKSSVSRFGDGEFLWLLEEKNTPEFQNTSKELSNRLKNVILTNNENLLVCIPKNIKNIKNTKFFDKWFWRHFVNTYGEKLKPYISTNKTYGNTNVTRFYMGYRNKKYSKNKIENLKKIWENKNILIVEGMYTRLGVGNNLLDNAKSIQRIICPSKNAYEKYDLILDKIKNIDNSKLILLALGPTATILAHDLCLLGYQAIDIGHIDIEYEWYLKKAKNKIGIEGKFVNEAKDKSKQNKDITDSKYKSEILYSIK